MKTYFTRHGLQISLIFLVFISALVAFFLLEDPFLKLLIVFSLAALYFLWGILHHYYEHDLTVEMILEYLIFAGVVLWVLINIV